MTISSVMMRIVRPIHKAPMSEIVLLPGLACDESLWRDQVPALRAAGHRVTVTDVHRRHASLPQMARALLRAHAGPLVLVGSSMGGMLALHAHREAPDRVAAMALLSTTAQPDTPALIQLRSDAIVEFQQGRAEAVLRINAALAFHPEHAADSARVDDYVERILAGGIDQLIAQNRAVMARDDMRPWLADVRCPVLVACGDADLLTPVAMSREIASSIPHAQVELVERAGHLMTWEQPEAVNRLLLHWLAGLGAEA
jgi:pimeloyl-ACP methyl ester carboxylesterase